MRSKWEHVFFDITKTKTKNEIKAFKRKCEDACFVAKCLSEHQKWRNGKGVYSWNDNPDLVVDAPLCPSALTIVVDSAIRLLKKTKTDKRND